MRKGIIVIVLIAASYFVFPQEATAADLPSGQAPASAPSAYEILGLVPAAEVVPVSGNQAGIELVNNPESQVSVPVIDEALDVSTEPSDTIESEGTDEPAATIESTADTEPLDQEPEAVLVTEHEVEPISEPEEEPLVSERTVPEGEAGFDSGELDPDAPTLAEPPEVTDADTPVDADNESYEDVLLAEIMRLMDERAELTKTIDGLKEENKLLSAKADEAAFYKTLAEGLEQKIAELEARLADTELALAESSEALLLAQDGLAASDETVQKLESALEVSESSLKDTRTTLEKLQEQLAKAESETTRSETEAVRTPSAGEAPGDARLGALAAERDAALAARAQAEAARKAAEAARTAAEVSRAATEAALAEALESGIVRVAQEKGSREAANGYLSGWTLDTSRFTRVLRSDLMDSSARMGTWVVQGAGARQTDASQYFSRLELPLAQDGKTLLYSFRARATGKGWVGLGLHFFVEDVVKRRGYGEGKSLLIWFTRDQAARGVDTTYLQLYRSDNDVVMERMFDAAIGDSLVIWRKVDIVYDPAAEYVAVSVDGVLRIVYKTFFGRTSGATMALRTLGGCVEFADFSVRGE